MGHGPLRKQQACSLRFPALALEWLVFTRRDGKSMYEHMSTSTAGCFREKPKFCLGDEALKKIAESFVCTPCMFYGEIPCLILICVFSSFQTLSHAWPFFSFCPLWYAFEICPEFRRMTDLAAWGTIFMLAPRPTMGVPVVSCMPRPMPMELDGALVRRVRLAPPLSWPPESIRPEREARAERGRGAPIFSRTSAISPSLPSALSRSSSADALAPALSCAALSAWKAAARVWREDAGKNTDETRALKIK